MKKCLLFILITLSLHSFSQISGIDVSKYQGNIKWHKIDTSKIKFVIVKATEGVKHKDKKFDYNWNNIPTSIYKGSYHFFRPTMSGKQQADFYLKTTKHQKNNIIPVIDIEYTRAYRHIKSKTAYKNLKDMIAGIYQNTGCLPIIYTTRSFWNKYYKNNFPNENDHILWIADYRKVDNPCVPNGWNTWCIWQVSSRGKIEGICKRVDLNIIQTDIINILIK